MLLQHARHGGKLVDYMHGLGLTYSNIKYQRNKPSIQAAIKAAAAEHEVEQDREEKAAIKKAKLSSPTTNKLAYTEGHKYAVELIRDDTPAKVVVKKVVNKFGPAAPCRSTIYRLTKAHEMGVRPATPPKSGPRLLVPGEITDMCIAHCKMLRDLKYMVVRREVTSFLMRLVTWNSWSTPARTMCTSCCVSRTPRIALSLRMC